ncbi:hypothetical protein J4403_01520 [Candidatus Woesearchaeota archaeon]|nr:hypothetical protein [Candidatus Woesearchaeota archaeon]
MSIFGLFKKKDPLENLKLDDDFSMPSQNKTDSFGMNNNLGLNQNNPLDKGYLDKRFGNERNEMEFSRPRFEVPNPRQESMRGQELELVNAKLDVISAKLDNLINRINALETKQKSTRW